MNTFKVETDGNEKWVSVNWRHPEYPECEKGVILNGSRGSDDDEEVGIYALLSYVEELQSKTMPSER